MTSTTISTSASTAVNAKYSSIATTNTSASYSARVAASFGYEPSQLADLPPNTNLGLSCGNPLATAHLQPDDVVIDLGSGGGLDCLIAAKSMVQASTSTSTSTTTKPLTGKVYGIDASKPMTLLAAQNTLKAKLPSRKDGSQLVQYVHAEITNIPIADSTASLIISNCVINLVDDDLKPTAFKEIYRLLQPGGRVAISDILTKKPLPESMRSNVALIVGCVAGAASKDEYEQWMVEAGFEKEKIVVRATGRDLNVYKDLDAEDVDGVGCCGAAEIKPVKQTGCCGPKEVVEQENKSGCGGSSKEKLFGDDVRDIDFNEWVGAFEIYAVK